jgi:hypothetical protein
MKVLVEKHMIRLDLVVLLKFLMAFLGLTEWGGQWNKALRFDGSSLAYIKAGSFKIGGGVSFSAWAYKDNLGNYQRVFDFGNGPDDQNLLLTNRSRSSEVLWQVRRGGDPRGFGR